MAEQQHQKSAGVTPANAQVGESLADIGNQIAEENLTWFRWYQPKPEGAWSCVTEQEAHTIPATAPFKATCATTYTEDEGGGEALYLSDFAWFDIDAADPRDAIGAMQRFLIKLEGRGVDLGMVRLYASGKKGFHIEIPMALCVDDWKRYLTPDELRLFPLIVKAMALEGLFVDGLDQRVYSLKKGRMWRVPNVRRPDTGTYKVQVSADEVRTMTPESYAALVAEPRAEWAPVAFEGDEPPLGSLWDAASVKALKEDGGKAVAEAKEVTPEKVERFKSLLSVLHPDDEEDGEPKHATRLKVIQAAHFELGFEAATPILRDWVQQSTSKVFKGSEWKQMLASSNAKSGKLVTMATLIPRARERGWVDPHPELNPLVDPRQNPEALPERFTDAVLAEFLAAKYGDRLCYVEDLRVWARWSGKQWNRSETENEKAIYGLMKAEARRVRAEGFKVLSDAEEIVARDNAGNTGKMVITPTAGKEIDRGKYLIKVADAMEGDALISKVRKSARSEPGFIATSVEFDTDPWLLNCENGVLDLKKGVLMAHDPELMQSQMARVTFDPLAKCPRWEKFMGEVTDGNRDLAEYLQAHLGWSLSGDLMKHVAFFMAGDHGRNGKGTIINVMKGILGDYAGAVSPDVILAKKKSDSSAASPFLMTFRGKRMMVVDELEDGTVIAEEMFKRLTGGSEISARDNYQSADEFRSVAKVWFATNHMPIVPRISDSMQARIKVVPFNVSFWGREDFGLEDALMAEKSGILNWLLEGVQMFLADPRREPSAVTERAKQFWKDNDIISQFIDVAVVFDEEGVNDRYGGGRVNKAVLKRAYKKFCTTFTYPVMRGNQWARESVKRFGETVKWDGNHVHCGFRLRESWVDAKDLETLHSKYRERAVHVEEVTDDLG